MRRRAEMGLVRAVNPARREIRLTPAPGTEDLFGGLGLVEVRFKDGERLRCRVAQVREETGGLIVTLNPGVTRETVARMKGATLLAEAETQAQPGFTFEDLDGLTVRNEDGGAIGVVTALYSAGGNDAFEVTRPDGSTFMLPAIPQVVAKVDIDAGALVVKDIAPYSVEEE